MEFQSSLIGLSLIIISWILLLIYMGNGILRKRFLIMYALGTAFLIIDSLIYDNILVGIFNLIILGLACSVLIKLGKKIKPVKNKNIKKKRK